MPYHLQVRDLFVGQERRGRAADQIRIRDQTAKTLGVSNPHALLATANDVIE
jgi:hypothetical protein